MGKYATYRKRGSHAAGPSGLPVPQTPVLGTQDDDLISEQASIPDPGGTIRLFFFETEEGEYTQIQGSPPAPLINWSELTVLESGFFKVDQVGGGTNYAGTSPRSAPFEYEAP